MNQMKRLVIKNRFFVTKVRWKIGRTIERFLCMFIVKRVDADIAWNRDASSPKAINIRHNFDVSKISLIKKDISEQWLNNCYNSKINRTQHHDNERRHLWPPLLRFPENIQHEWIQNGSNDGKECVYSANCDVVFDIRRRWRMHNGTEGIFEF